MILKKVLIISPHFPPVNAPDMQRVRMSLPYFKLMGWEAVVICVHESFVDGFEDPVLMDTIPKDLKVYKVSAFPKRLTGKFGLGSISMRSFVQFRRKGNQLLKASKFDLIFFSTSLFHVCALGPYWKKKFGVPFIIDMQDPWRNDYYLSVPKAKRPPKFIFAYTINKYLEAYTMPHADGIMAVSNGYIQTLTERYPVLKTVPSILIPFGASVLDFELVKSKAISTNISCDGFINVVYIGAITPFFLPIIKAFFNAIAKSPDLHKTHRFYFIGTNYAKNSDLKPIEKLANEIGIGHLVIEKPERISYFSTLATLQRADVLFLPGSMDSDYNASKVYNLIVANRPIFAIFNQNSLINSLLIKSGSGVIIPIKGNETQIQLDELVFMKMDKFKSLHKFDLLANNDLIQQFSAESRTKEIINFFDKVISEK